ncbi:MAG: T9SS type A sorting domain-containing protein [Saprospiraceae bacterium]|nr:T9SS type A sorting domain-containing protein [Saprospiraceae bacterium]MBK7738579.1 T9SS type A sorting domain-containing protein [Saprospiraceae bacterium]MBK7912849.1 T9SS type A sorting domain-containing protein [Saprospiraceae bacterium]
MIGLPGISNSQDTLICDNGGFEDEFIYYRGYYAGPYRYGSNTCTPLYSNYSPVIYTEASTLPVSNRFEIVPNGIDNLTGYDMVRFGQYALRLNSPRGHVYNPNVDLKCNFFADVNRLIKRFKVTEENRSFTVWYLAVLGNPEGHMNQQPFYSIRCDLAPNYDLCFDGISSPANTLYPSDDCILENQHIKTSDWACHRINIPKNEVGNIATLEFIAADCGLGVHMGYVYIDGICESCDNSSYGSGKIDNKPEIIVSCDGDSITIKGRYTTPTIDGYNILDDITVPGFNIYGLNINTTAKTFSFRIVKTDFQSPNPTCRDVIAYLKFKNASGDFLPDVPTNAVEICFEDFGIPDVDIIIGDCNQNDPNNHVFSDDYYYVSFTISNADNRHWVLERLMDDPYPDESGRYFLKTDGYGNGTYKLGPFLIQEGRWVLTLFYGGCNDTFQIIPPDYCSGCLQLSMMKISNIQCDPMTGIWSYDIRIPGPIPPIGDCWQLNGSDKEFNILYTIQVGQVNNQNCENPTIGYVPPICPGVATCFAQLDICPPKPCINGNYQSCDLEAYFDGINCIDKGNGTYDYTVEFNVSRAGYPCYRSFVPNNPVSEQGSFHNPLGPYNESERIFVIYSCGTIPYTCECPSTGCYKVFKIRKPEDCLGREEFGSTTSRSKLVKAHEVEVRPNPVSSDEWIISSSLNRTEFDIFNSSGKLILSSLFNGSEHYFNHSLPGGLYLLRYKNANGKFATLKFVKL